MKKLEQEAEQIAKSLRESVTQALDKKRRLGQYAVVWENQKIVRILGQDEAELIEDKKMIEFHPEAGPIAL